MPEGAVIRLAQNDCPFLLAITQTLAEKSKGKKKSQMCQISHLNSINVKRNS